MPQKFILKHSLTAGATPPASYLATGELALNIADGRIYYKNASNEISSFLVNLSTASNNSIAIGLDSTATHANSLAIGRSNTANGINSLAVGFTNNAGADYSLAIGWKNNFNNDNQTALTTGAESTAIGVSNNSSASLSNAIGWHNISSGFKSSAVGSTNTASGVDASAVGSTNTASGVNASAVGWNNIAQGIDASAIGWNNTAEPNSFKAVVMGYQNYVTNWTNYSSAIGCNNVIGTGLAAFTITGTNLADGNVITLTVGANSLKIGMGITSIYPMTTVVGGDVAVAIALVTQISDGDGQHPASTTITIDAYITNAHNSGVNFTVYTVQKAAALGYYNQVKASNSLAAGSTNLVTGEYSSALGYANNAYGTGSLAIGFTNYANYSGSMAVGFNNTINALNASAIGFTNTASGTGSVAVGFTNNASRTGSTAIGYQNTSHGYYSLTLGRENKTNSANATPESAASTVSGYYAMAIGYNNTADGPNASAIGFTNTASGTGSVAVGSTNTASSTSSVAVGFTNTASSTSSSAMGWTNNASSANASALGSQNAASSINASAIGRLNAASASNASALGLQNTASGNDASAMGWKNSAIAITSSAVGYYNTAGAANSNVTITGTYTVANGGVQGYITIESITAAAADGSPINASAEHLAPGMGITCPGISPGTTITSITGYTAGSLIYISATIPQLKKIASVTVNATGSSYLVNDVLALTVGTFTTAATVKVVTLYANAFGYVTNLQLTENGIYTEVPAATSATTPVSLVSGTRYNNVTVPSGLTVNIVSANFTGAINLAITPRGLNSSALGRQNTSIGYGSSALGSLNTTTGNYSSAVGYSNTALASNSSAVGYYNTAGKGIANTLTGTNLANSNQITLKSILAQTVVVGMEISGHGIPNGTTITVIAAYAIDSVITISQGNPTAHSDAVTFAVTPAGDNSSAIGYLNTATGNYSSAIGFTNRAIGYNSSAVGYNNETNAIYSSAIGINNTTALTANSAAAMGSNNMAAAANASAIGYWNSAGGTSSSAVGFTNSAGGTSSSAIGYTNTASGQDASALGVLNTANALRAAAIGWSNNRDANANADTTLNIDGTLGIIMQAGDASATIGYHNKSLAERAAALGVYNVVSNPTSRTSSQKNRNALNLAKNATGQPTYLSGISGTITGTNLVNTTTITGAATIGIISVGMGISISTNSGIAASTIIASIIGTTITLNNQITIAHSSAFTFIVTYASNTTETAIAGAPIYDGTGTLITSYGASAIGSYNTCIGTRSLAAGYLNTVNTTYGYSNAIGLLNMVSTYHSTAVGMRNTISLDSHNSIAIGNDVKIGNRTVTAVDNSGVSTYAGTATSNVMELGYHDIGEAGERKTAIRLHSDGFVSWTIKTTVPATASTTAIGIETATELMKGGLMYYVKTISGNLNLIACYNDNGTLKYKDLGSMGTTAP